MKFNKLMFASVLAAGCVAFTACSDDDDDNIIGGNDSGTPGVVNPSQVFTAGLPTQVGDLSITKGADGRVTKIVEDAGTSWETTYTFDYISSRAESTVKYDVKMTITEKGENSQQVFYITLNELGFAKYAYESYEGDSDEWWFGYNDNGQLNYMKRTENDNRVTTMTYDANGDITKVNETDDEGGNDSYTFNYTSSTVTTAIANKGAIMLFDDVFEIDMDEFAPAYYAGLLGKATTHLPVELVDTWIDGSGASQTSTSTYKWTLNADNNLPASLVISYDGNTESPIFFNWY